MKRAYRYWGEMDFIRLEEMRLQRKTVREIAEIMGRSFGSIQGALDRHLAPKPRSGRWYDLFSVPHSVAEVAKKEGVKKKTAYAARSKLRKEGRL